MNWNEFKKTENAGYLFIVLGVLNWSGNFVAARGLAGTVDPATLNLMRWSLATLVFLPFGIRSFWRERAQVARLWKELSIIAICGISLYDTLVFLAGNTSEALNMSLISTMSPLLTALVAQFFMHEKLKTCMYAGIVISTFGVALLVTDGSLGKLLHMRFAQGDLLILCTAMMSAVYNTVVKKVTDKISQTTLLMSCCMFGTLFIIPLYIWETGGKIVVPDFTYGLVVSLIYLSVFASILCYLFWNMAVEVLGASRTALFYYALPPASAVVAWFVIHEPVNLNQVVSGMIILAGIIFALYGDSPKFMKQKANNYG
ncbi:DMT family transporter [Maridesulfovibrio sp.]|uniref:DMT family transporter n=1 Tax=Maridesulfovibrio sp. TaxID=2795000 RepID=UPI002A18A56D|nr:DMT family transporter [Maridesulfovibrio sp.]